MIFYDVVITLKLKSAPNTKQFDTTRHVSAFGLYNVKCIVMMCSSFIELFKINKIKNPKLYLNKIVKIYSIFVNFHII